MDLDLARRFMLEYLPAEAQIEVDEIWRQMKSCPHMLLHNGVLFNRMQYLSQPDKKLAIAMTNGMLTGFVLAYSLKFPEVATMLEHYLDHAAKERGENVVNFLAKKGI